jgi:hypothetical protein
VHKRFGEPDTRNILPDVAPHWHVGIHFDQAFTRGMNSELEFFQLFYTEEMRQEVIAHTNTYAHIQITQKSFLYANKEWSWTSTNLEEIERLIAFLVYAVLVKVESEIENYWSVKTICHGLSRNRPGIRQFMKDKPTKWGLNLWVATDSSNGYTCDFEIHYL